MSAVVAGLHQCAATTLRARRSRGGDPHPCRRRGRFEIDGKWFCRTHAPALPTIETDVYESDIGKCECGCGGEVNPLVAVFRASIRDGFTHGETARRYEVQREYVSRLLRSPPRFIKGHNARVYWQLGPGAERRRELLSNPEHSLFVLTGSLSLDVPLPSGRTFPGGFEGVPDPKTLLDYAVIDSAERLRAIVGDMDPEDVLRMTEWDLQRLRDRLTEEGFAPRGVQVSERDRLKLVERHSGGSVNGSKSHGSRKKRREKIAHKEANRARGNSNRPAQKPRRRWTREEEHDEALS